MSKPGLQTAKGKRLSVLASEVFGMQRGCRSWVPLRLRQRLGFWPFTESDAALRLRCIRALDNPRSESPQQAAERILGVPVTVDESWERGEVVLTAKRQWWMWDAEWVRRTTAAQKAAQDRCFAGVMVEVIGK